MTVKSLPLLVAALLSTIGPPVMAQTLQSLQSQLKSMQACQTSITHTDCNLSILDKTTRDSLVQLDQLKQQQQRRQIDSSKSINSGGSTVQFFTDTISEVNGEVLRLMSGSTWRLDRSYFGLPLDDVVGIMSDHRTVVLYANDNSYSARLLDGTPLFTSAGLIRTVVQRIGNGSQLKLDDGSLLHFSSYDQYHTGWWLPPYKVLVDPTAMNMWNLNKGKKVWIQRSTK